MTDLLTDLLGRDKELIRIGQLVARTGDESALIVNGPAGIGKSVLLAAGADRAARAGHTVLATHGVESEVRLPFAGLHQLLLPLLHLVPRRPAPQRRALAAAFGEADGPAPEPFLIALGALNLLTDAAAERPVLLCVDDTHWLDEPSQDTLAFVARRLSGARLALLATVREGHPSAILRAGLPQADLSPLDDRAARALLERAAADLGPADRDVVLREAAGNPLALVELPVARRHAAGAGHGASPLAQPLNDRLEQAFAGRLDKLSAGTRAALLAAAVDPEDALPEILAAAGTLAGAPVGVEVVDDAVAAQLVAFDGLRLRFRHPLVRSAVIRAEPVARVLAAHAALADCLAEEPLRRVWHRAQSIVGFDDAIAEELAAGHTESLRRGSVLSAIRTLERAAELTTDSAARGRWLLLAAEHAFGLGHGGLVADLLRRAGHTELSDLDRARISWLSEIFDDGVPGDAERVFELCGLAELAHSRGDRDLALNLLLAASLRCWWADPGPAARALVAESAAALPGARPDPRAIAAIATAEPVRWGTRVREMLAAVRISHDVDPDTLRLLGQAAHAVGDLPRAVELFGRCEQLLREQGRLGLLSHVLTMQVIDRLLLGGWEQAARAVEEGRRVAAETGQPIWTSGSAVLDAIGRALRGRAAEALELAAQVEDDVRHSGLSNLLCCAQLARGIARLGAGDAEGAFADLRRMYDPADPAYHERESFDGVMFLAEAAVGAGRPDAGRRMLAGLRAAAAETDAPLLHVQLLYAEAVLADDADAEVAYLSALGRDLTRWPLVRARIELAHGGWLRRRHRVAEARGPLRSALTALDLLGAEAWAEQARAELGRCGEHVGEAGEPAELLSAQELEIARLAAQGMSNREIGQQLFLSPRTIGSHLYRIFPKLGITSRGQIAARLGLVTIPDRVAVGAGVGMAAGVTAGAGMAVGAAAGAGAEISEASFT
ncbi:AAA family ATPase [Catenulispora yoronensis]